MKYRNIVYIIIAFLALLTVCFALPDIEGLNSQARGALGVVIFSIIIWLTEALEDVISGFLVIFLLCILHVTTVPQALIGYSSSALWLIVVGFIMATSMDSCGLSKRIALILLNFSGGSIKQIYWSVAGVMFILTFLVPSITARVLLMLPIVMGIANAFNCEAGKSNAIKGALFIVSISGTMMSMAVITAHAANPITAGLIEQSFNTTVSWSLWFKVAALPAFLLSFISIILIILIWRPEQLDTQNIKSYIHNELQILGKFSKKETYTLVIFLITLLFWATDSIHKTPILLVGLASCIALLLPNTGVINWKVAQKNIPWNIFILYGAGLSMGIALVNTGAAKWLASIAFTPLQHLSTQIQLICIIWFVIILQLIFTGGGPKTTALMPIVIAFILYQHIDSVIFAIIIGINMLHQYTLPVNNMPNMIVMGSGYLRSQDIIKTGIIMSLVTGVFMTIMVLTYWQLLL